MFCCVRFTSEMSGEGVGDADHGQDMFSYEMGLRQFRSISDLMSKLMYDLQVSYDSFVTEFIRFPNNGVTRLCDLLKVIQLSQTNHKSASHHSSSGGAGVRTVQSDEFQTLLCLKVTITDFKYRIIPLSSTEKDIYNESAIICSIIQGGHSAGQGKPILT